MYALKGEHEHKSIEERWQAIDNYMICITECDINDQLCVSRCLTSHLRVDDGSDYGRIG